MRRLLAALALLLVLPSVSLAAGTVVCQGGTCTWVVSDGITVSGNLTVDTNTLFVDATNNRVGIGTLTPSHPLHIVGATGVKVDRTGMGTFTYNISNVLAGDTTDLIFQGQQNGGYAFYTNAGNNLALAINNGSNMSIGVAAPLAAHRLDVEGGHLKVGTAAAQKGITLYDTVDGSAHCVTINTNALSVAAGACS